VAEESHAVQPFSLQNIQFIPHTVGCLWNIFIFSGGSCSIQEGKDSFVGKKSEQGCEQW
jgi:hypothetical protein